MRIATTHHKMTELVNLNYTLGPIHEPAVRSKDRSQFRVMFVQPRSGKPEVENQIYIRSTIKLLTTNLSFEDVGQMDFRGIPHSSIRSEVGLPYPCCQGFRNPGRPTGATPCYRENIESFGTNVAMCIISVLLSYASAYLKSKVQRSKYGLVLFQLYPVGFVSVQLKFQLDLYRYRAQTRQGSYINVVLYFYGWCTLK